MHWPCLSDQQPHVANGYVSGQPTNHPHHGRKFLGWPRGGLPFLKAIMSSFQTHWKQKEVVTSMLSAKYLFLRFL